MKTIKDLEVAADILLDWLKSEDLSDAEVWILMVEHYLILQLIEEKKYEARIQACNGEGFTQP